MLFKILFLMLQTGFFGAEIRLMSFKDAHKTNFKDRSNSHRLLAAREAYWRITIHWLLLLLLSILLLVSTRLRLPLL